MSHDKIASVFDEWARTGRAEGMEDGHSDVVRQVLAKMDIRPGMQTLDLGCGNGWATRLLGSAAPGSGAVGIDVSEEMIKRADEMSDWTSRARFEVVRFEELAFADAKFDRAFSMEALYYSVDLSKAVSELFRVLKPNGTADVIVDRFKESPHTEAWSEMLGVDMHFLGEAEWSAEFSNAGFVDVSTERVLDSRGPGDEASFEPSTHCPDWRTRVELHEAGSLWVHARKPE